MEVEKLLMCRICLVQNVRMYKIVNKNLQKLYEKLTNVSFVTEDNRPILACFFCCAKLKQCGQFQKKCLEAEEQLANMLDKDWKPLKNHGRIEFYGGFIKTSVEQMTIDGVSQIEYKAIKEELPDVCDRQDEIIEPKKEPQSDVVDEISLHHSKDGENDVPLIEVKVEVEQQIPTKKRRTREVKSEMESESENEADPSYNTERFSVILEEAITMTWPGQIFLIEKPS